MEHGDDVTAQMRSKERRVEGVWLIRLDPGPPTVTRADALRLQLGFFASFFMTQLQEV